MGKWDGEAEQIQCTDPPVGHGVRIGRIKEWGAHHLEVSTGGLWTQEEQKYYINYLEHLPSFIALVGDCHSVVTLLQIDSVTAIAFVNKMGGPHLTPLPNLAGQDVEVVLQHGHISPCRASSKEGECESGSRVSACNWMIQRDIFHQAMLTIDLFASRTNTQLLM